METKTEQLIRAGLLVFAVLCNAAASASQAVPVLQQIYFEGEALSGSETVPGFDPIRDLVRDNGSRDIYVAPNGNFITVVNTDPFQANGINDGTSYQFGSTTQGTQPTAIRREGTMAGQVVEAYGSTGIDLAGNITYTASLTNGSPPPTRLSSLWENDTLIFLEGDAVPAGPLAGKFVDSAFGAYRSPSGVSSWISRYADSSLGTATGTAIFRDTTNFEVLLQSGDTIGSEGTVVDEDFAISGNIRWSDAGTNYITDVDVEPGFTSTGDVLVINGQPATTPSGGVIREGNAVAAADGGLAGETWDISGLYDVNNFGEFIFSGFNDGVVNDSVLALNGEIIHRENDIVDGVQLTGQVLAVGINDVGDYAFVWDKSLFINSQLVARERDGAQAGTLVDTDDDGIGDAEITNFALGKFEISNLPAAGSDFPVVYVAAEVNNRESRFRLLPAFADADDDGDNDGTDFLTWQAGVGIGTTRAEGDANGDANVDGDDLAIWEDSYGQSLPAALSSSAAASVPEPSTFCLLITALYWTGSKRRR
ncbi:MAG: hypothetical protein AAGD11_19015 [Planctomycetota bacterium]